MRKANHACKLTRKRSPECKEVLAAKGAVVTIEIADEKYDVAVANVVSFLKQIETADAEHTFVLGPDIEVIYRQK
jgi:hypothetical protein